jgi:hypothetical protein
VTDLDRKEFHSSIPYNDSVIRIPVFFFFLGGLKPWHRNRENLIAYFVSIVHIFFL